MDQYLATQISFLESIPTGIGDNHDTISETVSATLQSGRFVIASVDQGSAIRTQLGPDRWLNLIYSLQKIAYHDPDTGGEIDIASWCERQWATELQLNPDNVVALQGKGILSFCMRPHFSVSSNPLTKLKLVQASVKLGYSKANESWRESTLIKETQAQIRVVHLSLATGSGPAQAVTGTLSASIHKIMLKHELCFDHPWSLWTVQSRLLILETGQAVSS